MKKNSHFFCDVGAYGWTSDRPDVKATLELLNRMDSLGVKLDDVVRALTDTRIRRQQHICILEQKSVLQAEWGLLNNSHLNIGHGFILGLCICHA